MTPVTIGMLPRTKSLSIIVLEKSSTISFTVGTWNNLVIKIEKVEEIIFTKEFLSSCAKNCLLNAHPQCWLLCEGMLKSWMFSDSCATHWTCIVCMLNVFMLKKTKKKSCLHSLFMLTIYSYVDGRKGRTDFQDYLAVNTFTHSAIAVKFVPKKV